LLLRLFFFQISVSFVTSFEVLSFELLQGFTPYTISGDSALTLSPAD